MRSFAEKVRERRHTLKMTQDELGACIGISKRSVAAYETGEKLPRRNMMIKLAQALQVSEEYLRNAELDVWADPEAGTEEMPTAAPEAPAAEPAEAPVEEPVAAETAAPVVESSPASASDDLSEAMFLSNQLSALFAGGRLREEDKEAVYNALSYVYNKYRRRDTEN